MTDALRLFDDAALLVSVDGEVLACNELVRDTLGRSPAELVGSSLTALAADPAQLRSGLELIARSTSLTPAVLVLRDREGRAVSYRCRGARMESSPASPLILRLAPQSAANARFRELNETIERLSAEVLRRRQVEEELLEADRRKDGFLALLAHELRNPLAPITLATHTALTLVRGQRELERPLGIVKRQAEHLTRLVDDLLDLARITSGKIRLERRPCEVAGLVKRAVELARPLIESKRHRLEVSLPAQPVWVDADATRLTQALGNLLHNAAKYTDEGGSIGLSVHPDGGEVVCEVTDDGAGIPAELVPRLFEPFTQADTTLARSQGGLGIGLTLVREIVTLHGGTVEARSEGPGRGSTLRVRLPTIPTPASAPPLETQAGTSGLAPRRILVVDDNLDAAALLAELLSEDGHAVRVAHDGPATLEVARSHAPELVFLDIGLPLMDGYAVARELRREHGPGLKLVALTGYGREEDRRRAREAGFDRHLVKPVGVEVILEVLASLGRDGDY